MSDMDEVIRKLGQIEGEIFKMNGQLHDLSEELRLLKVHLKKASSKT